MAGSAAGETRRSFVVSSLVAAAGLVAGVLAVKAIQGDASAPGRPTHTDTEGLQAGDVSVPVADGTIPAYRAVPASGAGHPIVLVVHESPGLTEFMRDLCRRLGKLGYFAIAPDLFARHGDAASLPDRNERARKILARVPDAEVVSDLDAAAAYAARSPWADGSRLAMTGFGWGGRIVWLYAAHNRMLKAAVSWYAGAVTPTPLRTKNPIDVVADLYCPVLALQGAADEIIPQATVVKRQSACAAQHKICAYRFYPGVPHGFASEGHRHYRADAAQDGWARMLAWFGEYGVAPSAPLAGFAGGRGG